ncbi:MAG: hypothetical protein ACI9LO_003031 [Planctomycetota bacterium]|jgi:hypothetical protein
MAENIESTDPKKTTVLGVQHQRFVMRFYNNRYEYAIGFILIVLIPSVVVYLAGAALVVWYEYPSPTILTAVVLLWSGGEWNLKRKERLKLEALSQATRYLFSVAKNLDELDSNGAVFYSNDKFEILVRNKNIDA